MSFSMRNDKQVDEPFSFRKRIRFPFDWQTWNFHLFRRRRIQFCRFVQQSSILFRGLILLFYILVIGSNDRDRFLAVHCCETNMCNAGHRSSTGGRAALALLLATSFRFFFFFFRYWSRGLSPAAAATPHHIFFFFFSLCNIHLYISVSLFFSLSLCVCVCVIHEACVP